MIFLSPPMRYTCGSIKSDNGTARENVCPCDDPIWDRSIFTKTLQTKFGIICGRTWLISLSESITFFGLLVGALVFGFLSDRFGRLMIYSICQLVIGVAGCFVTLMTTILGFCIMRFLEGMGSGGAIVAGFVLSVELCGVDYRSQVSSAIHIAANFGLIALAGISYLIRDCDHFQLAVSVPVVLFFTIKFMLLESPKWLLDKNKKEEAIKVLEKFCGFNNKPYDTVRPDVEAYIASRTDADKTQMKFYHIFRYRKHTKNFSLMSYVYFVCGLCYYGVSQFIGKMRPRVHINTVFNGILLLLGTIANIFLINRFGRRPFLRTTMFLAGGFMLIIVFLPLTLEPSWVRPMFACLSNSFFYSSFIIIFLYGVELFPTNIRSSTLGVLSLVSRLGQVIGPQINALSNVAAAATFSGLSIIAGIITFFLSETKGVELPSSLESKSIPSRVKFSDNLITRKISNEGEPSK